MVATGNPIGAKEAHDLGLVDRLIEGDLTQHAVAFAEEVRDVRPIPRSSERDDKLAEARANPALFDEFRKANAKKFCGFRPEEHTTELQSLMRFSYDVFCLNTKKHNLDDKPQDRDRRRA